MIARVPLVVFIYALVSTASAAVRIPDLPYDSPGNPYPEWRKLDVYLPAQAARGVTIVYVHGGGYTGGYRSAEAEALGHMADAGYGVVAPSYTLANQTRASFPQAVCDIKSVVAWVRTRGGAYGLSPTVVVAGSSAGATIGLVAALSDDPMFHVVPPPPGGFGVSGAIGVSGRYDLVWNQQTLGTPAYVEWFLGGSLQANPWAWEKASAVTWAEPGSAPTVLFHGTADGTVPAENSVRLNQRLREAGASSRLVLVAGAGHLGVLGDQRQLAAAIVGALPELLARTAGACCVGGRCEVLTEAACAGRFGGNGTLCGEAGVCCRADFDGVNGVQVADIFAFLRAWFAGDERADFDGQGGVQVVDVFGFLRAWYAGC